MPPDPQVFIVIYFLHMHGEGQGEKLTLEDSRVITILQVFIETYGDSLSDIGKYIASLQFLYEAVNNLSLSGSIDDNFLLCIH